MQSKANVQVFEYRLARKEIGDSEKKRIIWVVAALLVITISALLAASFWMMEVNRNDFQQVQSVAHTQGDLERKQRPEWRPAALWFPLGYLLLLGLIYWARYSIPKRCSLTLTEDALIHACRLPFGLHALVPANWSNWSILLCDIVTVQVSQVPYPGVTPPLHLAQLHITPRTGSRRTISPVVWSIPGSPALPPLKPIGKHSSQIASPKAIMATWSQAENQALVRASFSDLPLVQALRARGVAVPDFNFSSCVPEHDLFACRSIKFGTVTGLVLIVAALVSIIGRRHQHLQADVPIWVFLVLGGVALLTLWLIRQRDARRARMSYSILGAITLIVGVASATQPATLLLNGLGTGADQSQAFVVRGGNLEPINNRTGISAIELPGMQSRWAGLKDGTEVRLTVKKGRLGLWEYDDTPLRQMADTQGIR